MIRIKNLHLHIALSALPVALISTMSPSFEPANPEVSYGFTKYDAAGNELSPDANEWHRHWQHDTNLEWLNQNLDNKRMQHGEAEKRLAELGDGWGLATDKQWEAEIDRTKYAPALRNADLFPGVKHEAYWTSSRDASGPENHAWVVYLGYGHTGLDSRHGTAWVRPCRVRRAPSQ